MIRGETKSDIEKSVAELTDEGVRLFESQDFKKSLARYRLALKKAQQDPDKSCLAFVKSGIGLVHLALENVEEAEQLFDEVRTTPEEKTPSDDFKKAVINALHGKASILIDRKDFEGAIAIVEKAIEMNPNVALSYFLKGKALFLIQQYVTAGKILSTCVDLANSEESFVSEAANYLVLISDLTKLDEAKKPNPIVVARLFSKNSSRSKSSENFHQRDRKKRLNLRKQLIVSPPTSPGSDLLKYPAELMADNSVLKGDHLLQEGYIEQAIRHYLSALEKNPGNIPALLGLGNAEIGQRNFEKAISHLDRAIETAKRTKTDCWEAIHSKVIALFQSNKHDLAITISSQIFDQFSLPPEVKNTFQCTLGILFFYQGKYSKAHDIFEPKEKHSKEQKSSAPIIEKNCTETCYNGFCLIFFALNQKWRDFYLSQATTKFKACLDNNPDRSINLLCRVGLFLAKNLATTKKLPPIPKLQLQEAIAYKEEEYFLLIGIFFRSTNNYLESLKFFNHAIDLGLISPHILNQKITTLTRMVQYYQIGEKSTDRNIKKQQLVMLVKIIAGFQEVLIHDPENKDALANLETLKNRAKSLDVAIPSPMAAPHKLSKDSAFSLENKTEPSRDPIGSPRLIITILSPRQNNDEKLSLSDSPLTLTSTPQQNHVRFGAQSEYQSLPGVVTQPDSPNPVSPTESSSPSNLSSNNSPENASSCNSPTSHSPTSLTPMLKPKWVGLPPLPPVQMNWHHARFLPDFNHAQEDPNKGIPVDLEIAAHNSRNRCTIL